MFERILKRMRQKVHARDYIMTFHAEEEKDADYLTIFDVEHCILAGEIVERQKDKATSEWKYRLAGKSLSGRPMELVGKFSPTGKLVIITVSSLE